MPCYKPCQFIFFSGIVDKHFDRPKVATVNVPVLSVGNRTALRRLFGIRENYAIEVRDEQCFVNVV